jgi:hypothetical protein
MGNTKVSKVSNEKINLELLTKSERLTGRCLQIAKIAVPQYLKNS